MKKFSLIATLLSAVLLLQNCKKDTATAVVTSNEPMIAIINDTTWIAKNVTATMTYNAATQTKVLTCSGLATNQQVNLYVTQVSGVTSTPGFGLATYTVGSTSAVSMSYEYPQVNPSNPSGPLVLAPQGVVLPGNGTVTITAVDSVAKKISGTFTFTSIKNNYDNNNNIVSFTDAEVFDGGFNNIPYTFTSN